MEKLLALTGEEPVEVKGYSSVIDKDGRFDTWYTILEHLRAKPLIVVSFIIRVCGSH